MCRFFTGALRRSAVETGEGVIKKWCRFQQAGNCQRSKFCTFAHHAADLGTKWADRTSDDRKLVLCKFWSEGSQATVAVTFALAQCIAP